MPIEQKFDFLKKFVIFPENFKIQVEYTSIFKGCVHLSGPELMGKGRVFHPIDSEKYIEK